MAEISDLLTGLPEPTPEAIRASREAAGMSPARAAEIVGLWGRGNWGRYEAPRDRSDHRAIPPQTWALWLLATGQHPALKIVPRDP